MKAAPSFSMLFSVGPAQEALFSNLTRVELLTLVRTLSTECRDWVDAELRHADAGGLNCGRPADLLAGIQARLLHYFVRIEGARVLLPKATYALLRGDEDNPAHRQNGVRPAHRGIFSANNAALAAYRNWVPEWREGYGPLQIAAGVTMVGEEGAVISGGHAGLAVEAEGVRFESLHLPWGVRVKCLGSLKMVKCTATGRQVAVEENDELGHGGHPSLRRRTR